ncbi:unnamed protein product, partial [marine sediment metagenome]
GLNENMKVLDVGCGIGGSSRTLVSNFGCNVTGIDLCEEFCRAAELINERLGYSNNIEIQQGDALDMPFNDNSYDIIFIQHVLMNIENKERLISEIFRLLRPKGSNLFFAIDTFGSYPSVTQVCFGNGASVAKTSPPPVPISSSDSDVLINGNTLLE